MTMKRNVLILVVILLSMVFQVANAQCVVKGKVVEQGTDCLCAMPTTICANKNSLTPYIPKTFSP